MFVVYIEEPNMIHCEECDYLVNGESEITLYFQDYGKIKDRKINKKHLMAIYTNLDHAKHMLKSLTGKELEMC